MLGVRFWVGVMVAGAFAALDPARGASSAPGSTSRYRVLHVCDCPPGMASDERASLIDAFARFGYVQGSNLDLATYDFGTFDASSNRVGPLFTLEKKALGNPYAALLTREIARNQAQLVLASGIRAAQGASEATRETPVVFWRVTDPIGLGLVDSLAHPGRNLTGFSRAIEKLTVKRLELIHEMLPRARRIAFMYIAGNAHHRKQADEVAAAGARLGLQIVDLAVPMDGWSPDRLEQTFAEMRRAGVEALLLPDTNVQPQLAVALAAKYRMPSIHALALAVTEWGGLAAYTTAVADEPAGVSSYAVRILKGEKAGDLPVQEPTQYELLLNLRAARDLGISFPAKVRLRATRMLEK